MEEPLTAIPPQKTKIIFWIWCWKIYLDFFAVKGIYAGPVLLIYDPDKEHEKLELMPRLLQTLLILAVGVVDIATDIYLPTMPLLTQYFSASEAGGALTISCYLVSFCLSGPAYGP